VTAPNGADTKVRGLRAPSFLLGLSDQSKGILLMIGGILLFTLMDVLAKHLGQSYAPLQVVWARTTGQLVVVTLILLPRLTTALKTQHPYLQGLRAVFQFGSVALFFLALKYIGLAEATAIMDVQPMLIALGAAVFLGEKLGPRRLGAVVVGFLGALIIIRPGAGVFSAAALLPLAAAFTYAGFAIITRRLGPGESVWTSMFYTAALGAAISTATLPFVWSPIAAADIWAFCLIGVIGAAGQLGVMRAFGMAQAGAIAPFGYVGLIFASLWGFVFFGELPDRFTVLGALVIVGAGLYVWHREYSIAKRHG
jgi:drug/metabolite transporter (DMT)-like permease